MSKSPISRSDFEAGAAPIEIDIGGTKLTAVPKQFSTGSFGWNVNGKATLMVNGKPVPVQVGANLIVIGSKEEPR